MTEQAKEVEKTPEQKKLEADQAYINGLVEQMQAGTLDPARAAILDMLGKSEEGIVRASKEANATERQIYELGQKRDQLNAAINNERGRARGFVDTLLAMRDIETKGESPEKDPAKPTLVPPAAETPPATTVAPAKEAAPEKAPAPAPAKMPEEKTAE
jgi:hypothetical protein